MLINQLEQAHCILNNCPENLFGLQLQGSTRSVRIYTGEESSEEVGNDQGFYA